MSQKERLSSLGRLSTVIAHEVRNPLMIIKASLHTLRQPRRRAPTALREAVADIDDEVARLNRIVNEVLDFARPIRFELAPADLNALCRESAAAAAGGAGAGDRSSTSIRRCRSVVDRRRAAADRAGQPARQRAPRGRRCRRRRAAPPRRPVDARRRRDTSSITHRRHAASASRAADLPRVFDPYFTTKRGGTGLGLPIAKNIVEGLGGTIAVASAPGRGTEIRIDLPARAPPAGSRADGSRLQRRSAA